MILSLASKKFDMSQGQSIAIPIKDGADAVNAWYLGPVVIKPVRGEDFIGDVNLGGAVNFKDIYFNPHGHGTHTETYGHISKEPHPINELALGSPCLAQVISVTPEKIEDDQVITKNCLPVLNPEVDAIVIRTLPNDASKKNRHYSDTNPPYIDVRVVDLLNEIEIKHILIDTPSVDRESDEGALAFHHAFWNYPKAPYADRTITELIYVPDSVQDGTYALQLFVAAFENDAAPSNPHLFAEIE